MTTFSSYDSEFTKKIRELRPDWFINTADEKKEELLEMARNEESRPSQRKHSLGAALRRYTNYNENSYDPEFTKEIKKLAPEWFVNTATENKKKLLEMVKKRI